MSLLNSTVEYRSFIEDVGYEAKYKSYFLEGIAIREVFASDTDMTSRGTTTVYFFPDKSKCIDENGIQCDFPHPRYGDRCVLRQGEANERSLLVVEAGVFTGEGALSHVRLKLR